MIRRRDARVQQELKPSFAMTIQVLCEGFIEGVAAWRFGEAEILADVAYVGAFIGVACFPYFACNGSRFWLCITVGARP
jgi:hypothetical protein